MKVARVVGEDLRNPPSSCVKLKSFANLYRLKHGTQELTSNVYAQWKLIKVKCKLLQIRKLLPCPPPNYLWWVFDAVEKNCLFAVSSIIKSFNLNKVFFSAYQRNSSFSIIPLKFSAFYADCNFFSFSESSKAWEFSFVITAMSLESRLELEFARETFPKSSLKKTYFSTNFEKGESIFWEEEKFWWHIFLSLFKVTLLKRRGNL